MKGCIHCGTKWKEGDVCPNCGRPVDPPAPNPARDGDGKSGTVWIVLALVFGLGLFLPMVDNGAMLRILNREKGIFGSGFYEVGKDLPAGEYIAVLNDNTPAEFFSLGVYTSAPMSAENQLMYGSFRDCQLLVLEEGLYIYFLDGTLYDMEKHENPSDPFRSGGMYKVGRDLEAGTYTFENTDGQDFGMYTLYTSIDFIAPITRDSGVVSAGKTAQIELHEGEYIEMRDCCLKP